MIEINSLFYSVGAKEILCDLNIRIQQGQKIAIVGKSGAGKSSLLKLIAGILHPTSGSIHFEGKRIKSNQEKLLPGIQEIQLVSQDFGLEIYQTVYQNIENKLGHLRSTIKEKFLLELLNLLDLAHISNQQVVAISGGEQQRLSIARALAGESKVILFDEPFVHLDVHIKVRLLDYLKKMQEIRNITYILVTHDGREALGFCDTAIYLQNGKIIRQASVTDFYNKPKSKQEALFFGEINILKIKNKTILMRANSYLQLNESAQDSFELVKISSSFLGTHYLTKFGLDDGQTLQLSSVQEMKDKIHILIQPKSNK